MLVPLPFSSQARFAPCLFVLLQVETQRAQWKRLSRTYHPDTGVETGVLPNKRLTAERLRKLEAVGFAWTAKPARKNSTNTAVSTLNGSTNDPSGASSPGSTLLSVCAPNVKPAPADEGIKNAPPTQQQARRNRLNDAQWEGEQPASTGSSLRAVSFASHCCFADMYQRLVNFRKEHGHTLVPRKYDKDPQLSRFVETMRIFWNRDFRKESPKEAVAAAAATAAATTVALADFASESADPIEPVDESASVMAVGGAVLHQQAAADTSIPTVNSNLGGAPVPAIPGAAKIAADTGKRLTPERKQKLDEIGFVWSLRSKRIEDHWDGKKLLNLTSASVSD